MKIEDYLKRPFKEWDKITPVYSDAFDKYFFNISELSDFCYEEEITDDENGTVLQLFICDGNNLWEIDFNDIFCDIMPEDMNIDDVASKELIEAMENINKLIKTHKPVSWNAGPYRTA